MALRALDRRVGRVIEIVSGQPLYQFEKQRIFDPLGMTSTKFVLDGPEEQVRMAEALPTDTILLQAERDRRDHPEWESGGGGLVSTITDYARFAQMILNGGEIDGKRYLSPAAFKNMTQIISGRVPASGVTISIFRAMALATVTALPCAPILEMPSPAAGLDR